jgi:hypothetical protein
LWGNPWAPYPTGPVGYFCPHWISPILVFRPYLHEKKARFSQKTRSRDAIAIRSDDEKPFSRTSTQRGRHYADGKNYKGDHKRMWAPVKRVEPKSVECSEDSNVAHSLRLGEHQSAEDVLNPKTCAVDGLADGLVQGKGVPDSSTVHLSHPLAYVQVRRLNRLECIPFRLYPDVVRYGTSASMRWWDLSSGGSRRVAASVKDMYDQQRMLPSKDRLSIIY